MLLRWASRTADIINPFIIGRVSPSISARRAGSACAKAAASSLSRSSGLSHRQYASTTAFGSLATGTGAAFTGGSIAFVAKASRIALTRYAALS